MKRLLIVGRYPPPVDGQTMATRRLASLLEGSLPVEMFNTSIQEEHGLVVPGTARFKKALHYLNTHGRLRQAVRRSDDATIFWASISPSFSGHLRDLVATAPAFPRNRRVFAILHRSGFERLFTHPVARRTVGSLVDRLAGVVFLTRSLSDALGGFIPDTRRIVIPNTIDSEMVPSQQMLEYKREQFGRHDIRILFFSNMIREKGYWPLLEAIRDLHRAGVALQSTFAGRWPSDEDRIAFLNHLKKYQLQDVVRHLGEVKDRAVAAQLYLEADVFVLPTWYREEAQPLSVLEAMAAGVPVVSTMHAGIPDMINADSEGILTRPDAASIAEALRRVTSPERWHRYSVKARNRFEAEFSPEIVRKRWLALLE